MSSMFFLKVKKKKKKVSGNHNNPTETSHLSFIPPFALFPFTFTRHVLLSYVAIYSVTKIFSSFRPVLPGDLSPVGVDHDSMKKELSLVCHMKHFDEKSLKTKTLSPPSFVLDRMLHGKMIRFPGCLGRYLQFSKAMTAQDKVNMLS